eukprot:10104312-Alexandrium_andersonii.AAC.1
MGSLTGRPTHLHVATLRQAEVAAGFLLRREAGGQVHAGHLQEFCDAVLFHSAVLQQLVAEA